MNPADSPGVFVSFAQGGCHPEWPEEKKARPCDSSASSLTSLVAQEADRRTLEDDKTNVARVDSLPL